MTVSYFGRIAHLIDAVEDMPTDRPAGSFNALLATGTSSEAAREFCAETLAGLRGSVAALALAEPALTESLLVREVGVAVEKAFVDVLTAARPGATVSQPHGPGWRGLTVAGCRAWLSRAVVVTGRVTTRALDARRAGVATAAVTAGATAAAMRADAAATVPAEQFLNAEPGPRLTSR